MLSTEPELLFKLDNFPGTCLDFGDLPFFGLKFGFEDLHLAVLTFDLGLDHLKFEFGLRECLLKLIVLSDQKVFLHVDLFGEFVICNRQGL